MGVKVAIPQDSGNTPFPDRGWVGLGGKGSKHVIRTEVVNRPRGRRPCSRNMSIIYK